MPKRRSSKVLTSGVDARMSKRKSSRDWIVPPLRLYMVKGSFFIEDNGAAMSTEVWSKLPEEMIWEVMRFVPAATRFRLQSVSRKWRQVLTSAGFRNTLTAAASRQLEAQQQPPVVAGVITVPRPDHDSSSKLKVVEVDLTSFVPSWFWKTDSYTVEAAADGLVCISNDSEYWTGVCDPEETRFCVLNPLTRTCKVLPKLPGPFEARGFEPRVWLQPTPSAVTIFGYMSDDHREAGEANVATFDLSASGSRVLAAYNSIKDLRSSLDSICPVVALCAGETYLYDDCHVLVLVPGPGGRLVEAAVLDEPSVALLGIDASLHQDTVRWRKSMVVHRDTLFYVENLCGISPLKVVLGVWRLARKRLEWEAVARLDVAELKRLTGLKCIEFGKRKGIDRVGSYVWGALGVRELLCCSVTVDSTTFQLGLNLDTGEWELVHDDQSPVTYSALVELRPDLFL